MDIIEFVDSFNSKSDDELVKLAVHATSNLFEYFESINVSDDEQAGFIIDLFKLFVSADRYVSEQEYALFLRLLNETPDYLSSPEFYEMMNGGADKDFIDTMVNKIKALPEEMKLNAVSVGLAIICIDHEVTMPEYDIIYKII